MCRLLLLLMLRLLLPLELPPCQRLLREEPHRVRRDALCLGPCLGTVSSSWLKQLPAVQKPEPVAKLLQLTFEVHGHSALMSSCTELAADSMVHQKGASATACTCLFLLKADCRTVQALACH